jgi:UDP-N-acetylglucosamine 1-carboxyvinyltransferase
MLCDPHRAVVMGHDFQSQLKATTMSSPDIRAGISLLIAALSAKGTSTIQNIEQIDRGYERIDERLRAIRLILFVLGKKNITISNDE